MKQRRLESLAALGLFALLMGAGPSVRCGADTEPAVVSTATEMLLIQGKPLTFWTAALRDERWAVRADTANTLGAIGEEAIAALPSLVAATKDTCYNVRMAALCALRHVEPDAKTAAKVYLAALQDDQYPDRWEVVILMAEIAKLQPDAAGMGLAGALRDDDVTVRCEASHMISALGPAAVPLLINALSDPSTRVRAAAAASLGSIGKGAEAAIVPLCYALRDDEMVSHEAMESLTCFGGDVKVGVPVLLKNLSEGDWKARVYSAALLVILKEHVAATISPMRDVILKDRDDSDRRFALRILQRAGAEARSAAPTLLLAATDPDEEVQTLAADALREIDPETASHVLDSH